jgi:alpha-beta hydrolase superfamily lysophospholipase
MRRALYFSIAPLALLVFLGAAVVGSMLGGGMLHPVLRPLSPDLIQQADRVFQQSGASRKDFIVTASDGTSLRGWKVYPHPASGAWVLLFQGMSDNRAGMLGQAQLLLNHGYSLVMMDQRAHGESGGAMATYGWLERADTQAVVSALYATETPRVVFALGSSMGAAIALQSAAVEPRIAGVVAESSFSDLTEATYDYAGLHWNPWLGKTLFRPATWTGLSQMKKQGDFAVADFSPEKAVARRPFPVLLICDSLDRVLPCRHSQRIFDAATGPKQLWVVPQSDHAAALGTAPAEYEHRVIAFFDHLQAGAIDNPASPGAQ